MDTFLARYADIHDPGQHHRVITQLRDHGLVTFSGIQDRAALLAAAVQVLAIRPHRDAAADGITVISAAGDAVAPGYAAFTDMELTPHPLEALLLAERAALLSGRYDDFTMVITIGYTGLRSGESIGLERGYLSESEIHVEWQLREVNGILHRLPPKDDSYRSPNWEPCLPVDLPAFLAGLLTNQAQIHADRRCACCGKHGGSGRYVFLGPDGGHYRRSNYARRVFRPACDGRYEPGTGRPARLVIADATIWPGVPVAMWPATQPGTSSDTGYTPPTGRGIRAIPEDTPLGCWLPVKPGLTPHGLRHSHKTWMAEDGIPEILAEQRLGHEVPGMRGLYAHASDRMRDELRQVLQARWEDSLRARAGIDPHSPVPLLDELLAPFRAKIEDQAEQAAPRVTQQDPTIPRNREKLISQVPPRQPKGPSPATKVEPIRRASDLARHQDQRVELRGFEPLIPSMRTKRSLFISVAFRAARWGLPARGVAGAAAGEPAIWMPGKVHAGLVARWLSPPPGRLRWWPVAWQLVEPSGIVGGVGLPVLLHDQVEVFG
jgi:integrase